MGAIVLVDTSILLNVLDIPGRNEERADVLSDLKKWINDDAHLRIPMAAIFEAGNHIANSTGDGQSRRTCAHRFVKALQSALNDEAPWKPIHFPDHERLASWLTDFPDAAMRGHGMGDHSIRKEWESQCDQFPLSRVIVWSLDDDLAGLDRAAHHSQA